jgi:4-hydroxy-3-methylbut-2-enyl diphosphate reductase
VNRTILRQALRITGVVAGEVVVSTAIEHPDRGPVRCPAAPLVASEVMRAGITVRFEDVPITPGRDAILFLTSYIARDGTAIGLGAAASVGDPRAVSAARHAIDAWSAVLRTRRVLHAAADPLCRGARAALEVAAEQVAAYGPCYAYGEPQGYQGRDVIQIAELSEVPPGARVLFPAQGVPLAVRAEAAARGLHIIDATCPLAEISHAAVRDLAADGDTVVVIGRHGHAAAKTLTGQAPERVVFAQTAADLTDRRIAGRVSYVLQPGVPVEELIPVAEALHGRRHARPAHPDGWCYASSDRAASLRAVAAESQLLLILGDAGSADARELCRLVPGTQTHIISCAGQIRPQWVAAAATIGLAETQTTIPGTADLVTAALSGIGPLSVARRRHVTERAAVPVIPRQGGSTAQTPRRRLAAR